MQDKHFSMWRGKYTFLDFHYSQEINKSMKCVKVLKCAEARQINFPQHLQNTYLILRNTGGFGVFFAGNLILNRNL